MIELKDKIRDMSENKEVSLSKEFDIALKDDKFKKIADKLKLKKDLLCKYTSTLKTCSDNYDKCLKCKNIMECKQEITGYCYLPFVIDNKLNFNYQPCKYKKELVKETKYLKNTYLYNEPSELNNASIKDIYIKDKNRFEAIENIQKFLVEYRKDKNQKGIFLYGNFGCGKTYLVCALFNELAKENIKSAVIFWPEFLRELKSSFSSDFKEKYEYIKKIELLLIDDIGAENTTLWSRDEILGPLLQYRMQEKKPTFFTSNFDLEGLEQHFAITKDNVEEVKAKRIMERIKQLTVQIQVVSKNLRN
ncbi:MAG: primosomal protein DnaI [Clostridium sp.]|nr:primosomal protein DnaI [Clostridium sp.]MCM1444413.1 primosomal protein DnaI [Candidatus Amulumruptor caecigallinarius]